MSDYNKKAAVRRIDDLVYMLWIVTSALEAKADGALDRNDVTGAFNLMNDIGYTENRPTWETKKTK